jgi:hypothetical protein
MCGVHRVISMVTPPDLRSLLAYRYYLSHISSFQPRSTRPESHIRKNRAGFYTIIFIMREYEERVISESGEDEHYGQFQKGLPFDISL